MTVMDTPMMQLCNAVLWFVVLLCATGEKLHDLRGLGTMVVLFCVGNPYATWPRMAVLLAFRALKLASHWVFMPNKPNAPGEHDE